MDILHIFIYIYIQDRSDIINYILIRLGLGRCQTAISKGSLKQIRLTMIQREPGLWFLVYLHKNKQTVSISLESRLDVGQPQRTD